MAEFDFIPQIESFVLSGARNAMNTTDVWLRGNDGLPLNQSPARIPFDATLVNISATGNASGTWDAEVYIDADVRAGGTPSDANKIAELALAASDSASSSVSVDVVAGTEIGIFMRGSSINRPRVDLFFIRKIG